MKFTDTDQIVNAILAPNASEEAAVAGFRILHQNATTFGGLDRIFGRSHELLAVIAHRDAQIESLRAQVETAKQALKSAERSRKAFAAEQAAKKEGEVETRMLNAVVALIRGSKLHHQPKSGSLSHDSTVRAKVAQKAAAKASSRPRVRRMPRGFDTENTVLSLLTNDLKCISTLFREAQRIGFQGTENAIRFACARLAMASNAEEGRDHEGRTAFRRA